MVLGGNHVPTIFGYRVQREGKWWGIYWISGSSTLCATDYGNEFFSLPNLERKDRKKLLKNVAESLVETRWKNLFNTKGLKVGKVSAESVELTYILQSIELPRVEDDVAKKNEELHRLYLEEVDALNKIIDDENVRTGAARASSPVRAAPTPSMQSHLDKNRRKRAKATGAIFND